MNRILNNNARGLLSVRSLGVAVDVLQRLLACLFFAWSSHPKVEYAIEAINNAGTCVGILAKDGIVMAAERKVISKLLAPSKTSEKTYRRVPLPCIHVQLKTFH